MASASYTLDKLDNTTTVFTLVGNTIDGAEYRDSSRSLGLPQSVKITTKVGNPGAKGNDHVIVVISNVIQNSVTGAVSTGSVTMDLSVPRDAEFTDTMSKDLLAYLQSFLSDARIANLADALVP